jgi:DNA-directed RNA polymerase subunit RPC12/RpoP
MKKVICFTTLFFMSITLCSCEVHFGSTSYDVPWWVIAVPVIIFSAVVFYIAGKIISKKKYTCPSCGHTFHPKWWKSMFSVHINSERVFRCPHCGKKDFCHISYNSEQEG